MASWTSVSLISGSAWDGPTGCPILSPSLWNPMVVDNLEVLSAHNHSGSAGEGGTVAASFFPALDGERIPVVFPAASDDGWTSGSSSAYTTKGIVSASLDGQAIYYPVFLRSGVYDIRIVSGCGTNRGIMVACINGACIIGGSIDTYSATGGGVNASAAITACVVGSGEKRLALAINGKNSNSTGYLVELGGLIQMTRTGD